MNEHYGTTVINVYKSSSRPTVSELRQAKYINVKDENDDVYVLTWKKDGSELHVSGGIFGQSDVYDIGGCSLYFIRNIPEVLLTLSSGEPYVMFLIGKAGSQHERAYLRLKVKEVEANTNTK